MRRFADIAELRTAVGQVLGESDWVTVTQETIDLFAEATGDHQWIHVDRERAKASPFGTTIAHGFLTLSLIPRLIYRIYGVGKIAASLNYGSNKVRFITPVPSGGRIRARLKLLSAEDTPRGVRITSEATVELEGSERPACTAELVAVLIPTEA
ncbi:MAG TPA: MaoC family dehydratase [Stellaceae bacterium]|jgi:acyl dehydratase|nr:MaoC family dehydratase [Stellaceae bacterium]